MKKDKYPTTTTTRQEWSVRAESIQEGINYILEEIRFEIEAANLALEVLYQSDPEAAGEYAVDIIEYLDSLWDYSGDVFLVSGHWHEPMIGMNEEGIFSRHVKKDAFNVARSNGFMVKPIGEGEGEIESPRVGLSFVVAGAPISTPSIQGHFELLAFAEPQETSLQYLRPGDASVVSSDLGEVGAAMSRADALLDLYLNHEDSGFYRAGPAKQEAFLKGIADSLAEVMPAPDTIDKIVLTESITPVVYTFDHPGPGLNRLVAKDPDKPFKITGTVEYATIVDHLIDGLGRGYKSPDELSTSKGGLGLVIKPYSCNFELNDDEGKRLIVVPMRLFKVLSLTMQ